MIDRNSCLGCAHFRVRMAETGWSEYTPGSDMSMGCEKGVWEHDAYEHSEVTFRANMALALYCADFLPYQKEQPK